MKHFRLALDWTPNTNHIGIFVAKELGFYTEQNIDPDIISPLADNYSTTPGKKLELGDADAAIAPFETVISLSNKKNKVDAIAVFAILQDDLSSIAALQSSHISRPGHLDGKIYASYGARYEDNIVQEMIRNDGSAGSLQLVYPDKLGIWNTLLAGTAEATWIFDNWEGIEAATQHIALTTFKLSRYNIPYGYSPVIIVRKSSLEADKEAFAGFAKATRKGYLYAATHQAEAADVLKKYVTESDSLCIDINASLRITAEHFGNNATLGMMAPGKVNLFLQWLVDKRLESPDILTQSLFTNELLG